LGKEEAGGGFFVMSETKICSKCGEEKTATTEYFKPRKDSKDGLYWRCRECTKIEDKKYREEHKEQMAEYRRKNKEKIDLQRKEYREKNKERDKEKIATQRKQYYEKNKERILTQQRQYAEEHKETIKEKAKIFRQNNKEKIKAEQRKYYEQHREEIIGKQQKYIETHQWVRQNWKLKNKEKIKAYQKQYNIKNKEKISIQSQKYKTLNKDKIALKYKKYRQLNKEKVKIWNNNRRVRINKSIVNITQKDWQECLEFFNYKDAYTGLPMETTSMDHVVPVCKGGLMVRQNLVPCEKSVNSSKATKNMEEWYRNQSFFDEQRLNKIYQWIGVKKNIQQLSII
jgi:hypothetical protein